MNVNQQAISSIGKTIRKDAIYKKPKKNKTAAKVGSKAKAAGSTTQPTFTSTASYEPQESSEPIFVKSTRIDEDDTPQSSVRALPAPSVLSTTEYTANPWHATNMSNQFNG